MKKRLLVLLFICMMSLPFAIPVIANEAVANEPVIVEVGEENTINTEMTRIYYRNYHGVLQWRLWGITSGKWLTEWANV